MSSAGKGISQGIGSGVRDGNAPEFNEFLYAPIHEDSNGLPLSVLSAFARLGLDPWEQAALLASQPRDAAAQSFSLMMSALPGWSSTADDAKATVARLIDLLPQWAQGGRRPQHTRKSIEPAGIVRYRIWVFVLVIAFSMTAQWVFANFERTKAPATAPVTEAVRSSSMAPATSRGK